VKGISHEGKRRQLEALLEPPIQSDPTMRLPLWVWVQVGCVPAMEALLRNAAHEEEVNADVVIALHRCASDSESRSQIEARIREHVGDDAFNKLQLRAATTRLISELRQACDEERDVDVALVRETLALGADPNAREESEAANGRSGLSGLALLAMNCSGSAESVQDGIKELIGARADVNIESDEASTPLSLALQHRNMPAVASICQGVVKFTPDLLDEVKTISEPSRRHHVEDLISPVVRGNAQRRLPLWVWVQEGNASAVQALLRNVAHDGQIDTDVVVALQRCRGDETAQQRIAGMIQNVVGDEEFDRLQKAAATRCLLQELREAYDEQRGFSVDVIKATLNLGANPNAHEEDASDFDDYAGAYNHSALQLIVTNLHAKADPMQEAVSAMVAARVDINMDRSESALLSAIQHRCLFGVEMLSKHNPKVTPDILEELKNISGTKARLKIEEFLRPLIDRQTSLLCPLWIWVQAGVAVAVEAMLRNSAHDEDVDVDVIMALQRCCCAEESKERIAARIREHVGEDEFRRLSTHAATYRLLMELREAHTEGRDFDLEVVRDALHHGANPNAREEDIDDDTEEALDEDNGENDEEEDGEEDDGEEDGRDDDADTSDYNDKEDLETWDMEGDDEVHYRILI